LRCSNVERNTNETQISLKLDLDGSGKSCVSTGIGFLDHMLTLFSKHGRFDLDLTCKGDIEVDCHHTVEDVGIVLGEAILQALGDKKQITRYGNCSLPMDEALTQTSLDISGRPYLVFNAKFNSFKTGEFETEMTEEFFKAVAFNAGLTLHINMQYGKNDHHIIESMFKGFARALKQACTIDKSIDGIPSTKGVL